MLIFHTPLKSCYIGALVEECVSKGLGLGPILCAASGNIWRDALNRHDHVYNYKASVEIPLIGMIDDIAHVQECGVIVAKFEQDNLGFKGDKCHKIHVSKSNEHCPTLRAHQEEMEVVLKEKYLGDIVTSDSKHTSNIKRRSSKCISLIADIIKLKILTLGEFHFIVAVILRQVMLLSVMLINGETWLRLTKCDMERLESVDHILNCDPSDMIYKVLFTKINKPAKNNWCNVVEEDLQAVGLGHLTI